MDCPLRRNVIVSYDFFAKFLEENVELLPKKFFYVFLSSKPHLEGLFSGLIHKTETFPNVFSKNSYLSIEAKKQFIDENDSELKDTFGKKEFLDY